MKKILQYTAVGMLCFNISIAMDESRIECTPKHKQFKLIIIKDKIDAFANKISKNTSISKKTAQALAEKLCEKHPNDIANLDYELHKAMYIATLVGFDELEPYRLRYNIWQSKNVDQDNYFSQYFKNISGENYIEKIASGPIHMCVLDYNNDSPSGWINLFVIAKKLLKNPCAPSYYCFKDCDLSNKIIGGTISGNFTGVKFYNSAFSDLAFSPGYMASSTIYSTSILEIETENEDVISSSKKIIRYADSN